MTPWLSIVIPALNEADTIVATLARLQALRAGGHEVIVVDGGSTDATVARAEPLADRILAAPRGRARQMNAGAAVARGDVLVFLHADTRLPEQAVAVIRSALRHRLWGRFDVDIEGRAWMLRMVAAGMNLRSRLTGIATGDQTLFISRTAFAAVGGYPEQSLMEDIELSKRLNKLGPPACPRERVVTSGRRWEVNGVWRTILLMWRLRFDYWRGVPATRLATRYHAPAAK
ncbi:MAG: glycosyl transferase [Hydrogenophilaceae bacterium CG1_02_62_390]|nr:glycosyltransferase family 2 protein [Betaproteobacteria bacterium]OIO78776.1 MAG: glycosyl transferase [Hydrogenophilaceae bacterium CG1_02_62_390]PIW38045.1 MAG: glycosyl transferase [Hydrogenophilales bacterium CG15_BIG_FIL_POST_REV_8_21_14_020_62_31]PIX02350.1 MAG: glycosyl transferase [Hydrogenophilales bacterium CG_4_8_14_3_um_filter_62_83]